MAVASNNIVLNGLVYCHDSANGKSFVGGPVTNVLPSPNINGYPTFGNSWGTYNTNQYNGSSYFSIGTVSSVSGNVVTMSAAHPLRSFDVVRAQTSGGGVTAGTDYIVQVPSSTTFVLYPYNGSQDGSQGYINPSTGWHKVYDSIASGSSVSVSASGFPTMWWGAPHLPNSGLVKEIIPNGFNGIVGQKPTDCIRCHWDRLDGVTDGMAYSVDAPVVVGNPYTVSFWTRAATPNAVGNYLSYQIYNYGGATPTGFSFNAVIGPYNTWTRQSMTFTPTVTGNTLCISYWFPNTGPMKVDIANIQFEAGSIANNFAPGTRSNTQALLDLTNKNTITANSLTYSSTGTFSFGGSDYCTVGSIPGSFSSFTVCVWFNSSSVSNYRNPIDCNYSSYPSVTGNVGPRLEQNSSGQLVWTVSGNTTNNSVADNFNVVSSGLSANTWYYACITWTSGSANTYLNGNPVTVGATTPSGFVGTFGSVVIGKGFSLGGTERSFIGQVPVVQIYNRALSATEISQNFNALRKRFGV